jgi:hypothetical protein
MTLAVFDFYKPRDISIMSTKSFAEHGIYTLQHEQNIIIFEAQGAWNIEASAHAIAEIKQIVNNLASPSHAFIFDTSKVEGMTPESFVAWSEAVDYWLKKGFKGLVRIDEPTSLHYKMFVEAFDTKLKTIISFSFAKDVNQGLDFLHSLGFKGFKHD